MKVFKEEQRFTQLWLIILVIFSSLVPIGILISEFINNSSTFSIISIFTFLVAILIPLALLFLFKLTTKIDEQGIFYQFYPFHFSFRKIGWNEISKAYVRTYEPIGEYGGWGLKGGTLWNSSKGKAINVSGDIGIQLELKTGKKLLIGTQKKTEVARVLETYKSKIN